MITLKNELLSGGLLPNLSSDAVKIEAGAVVIDNSWINYDPIVFRVNDYITSIVVAPRTRFFTDRDYAVMLIIGIDIDKGVTVLEGAQIPFSTLDAVPYPENITIVPLMGIILIQDGTADLNMGYKVLKNEYLKVFSGSGNILDKNIQGPTGIPSNIAGTTGAAGITGYIGRMGETGAMSITGYPGLTPVVSPGETGLPGITGINWNIEAGLEMFF